MVNKSKEEDEKNKANGNVNSNQYQPPSSPKKRESAENSPMHHSNKLRESQGHNDNVGQEGNSLNVAGHNYGAPNPYPYNEVKDFQSI